MGLLREKKATDGDVSSDWRAAIKASGRSNKNKHYQTKDINTTPGRKGFDFSHSFLKRPANSYKSRAAVCFFTGGVKLLLAARVSQGECNLIARD